MSNTKLIPELRFPEFKNDGEWVETTLNQVANYENGKAHEKEISANGKYKVVNSKFISTDGLVVKFTDSANLKANIGDILMVLSDIPNGKAIAKCFYVDKENTYTVNQRICKITPKIIDNKFLFYIQNRNRYFLTFDDGVKQTNLRKDTVLAFPFQKPQDLREQQKIASCLSSLDELIAAHRDKLGALKDHKKGLMQNLFPNSLNHDFKGLKDAHDLKTGKKSSNQVNQKNQGSDNVPNYRFPEFQDDGEWESDTVQNIVTTKAPPKKLQSSEYLEEGIFPIIDQSQSFYCGYTNDQHAIINKDLPLVIFGDHTCALKMAREPFAQGADGIKILKPKAFIDPEYLYQYLTYNGIKQENYKRHYSKLKEKTVSYPEFELGEQQKIASCLSAVDELITAQQEKIEQLQQHKKGLMQGMFPEPSRRMFPKIGR
jgi:type I restriction enzyme S subunit